MWSADPLGSEAFGDVAASIHESLRDAGYTESHWYPIGVEYMHGFAATTRLEGIREDGTSKPAGERWSSMYPEAATLDFLSFAREAPFPAKGLYRAFLIAFSDLPTRPVPHRAPRYTEQTEMIGLGFPMMRWSAARRSSVDYRLRVYVYVYEAESADEHGEFVQDDEMPPALHVERAGLSSLGAIRAR
jgi:hypothetical protein